MPQDLFSRPACLPTYLLPLSLLYEGMPVQVEADSLEPNRATAVAYLTTERSLSVQGEEAFAAVFGFVGTFLYRCHGSSLLIRARTDWSWKRQRGSLPSLP
jgi:hypothetical protein